jgi:S1-C subfamily serine protease
MVGAMTNADSPRPRPRPSRFLRGLAAISAVVLGVGLAGCTAAREISEPSPGTGSTARTQPGSLVGGTPQQGSGGLDVDAVAGEVEPAVASINVTIAGGRAEAAGTGFVVSESGDVITNNHVIENATDIRVRVGGNGRSYSAEVLGYNVKEDIALLKLEDASDLDTVATDTSPSVGESIVALGNALGRGAADPTTGTVTAVDQTITVGDVGGVSQTLSNLIRIDASLEPGDSGGPLVDADGEVIGVNTAASRGGRFRLDESSSTGYAVPIGTALSIADQIQSGEGSGDTHVGERALLGVAVQDLGSRGGLRDGTDSRVAVTSVQSGSPADDAGISEGDMLVSLAGRTIDAIDDLASALAPHHPGDRVEVSWIDSSGDEQTARVTLTEGPPA